MKNKITVAIAGQEYTMVAEEDENYVHRCATLVDSQVRDVTVSYTHLDVYKRQVLGHSLGPPCILESQAALPPG